MLNNRNQTTERETNEHSAAISEALQDMCKSILLKILQSLLNHMHINSSSKRQPIWYDHQYDLFLLFFPILYSSMIHIYIVNIKVWSKFYTYYVKMAVGNKHDANDDSAEHVKSDSFFAKVNILPFHFAYLRVVRAWKILNIFISSHAECEYLFSYEHDGKKSNILYLNITSHFSYSIKFLFQTCGYC